jgi:signal transduction histidine kinase
MKRERRFGERPRRRRLVEMLGHDLREPLASITMNTHALLATGELPDRLGVMVERIARSALRMSELVRDRLDDPPVASPRARRRRV